MTRLRRRIERMLAREEVVTLPRSRCAVLDPRTGRLRGYIVEGRDGARKRVRAARRG